MSSLEKAISIASLAHKGQLDKAGKPYILHPLRIMLKMDTEDEMIAAVLHDVVEDCKDWTFERLELERFNYDIITALMVLTHNKNEDYDTYIEKIATNKIALKVKLADFEDNMDLTRIAHPTQKDYKRFLKYRENYDYLSAIAEKDDKIEFIVSTFDNFHMYDEDDDGADLSGPFSTQEEAISAAKEIVDKSLRWERSQSKDKSDPKELYERYKWFGNNPIIRPDTDPPFSAWDYAETRCVDICKEPIS